MSYPVPTLDQAVQRSRERLRAEMPGTDAAVWPNTQAINAKVTGGESFELYGFLQWIARQRFATSADGDMLDQIGEQYAVARRPATYAAGRVTVTGQPLYTLLAGQVLTRSDDVAFVVDADTAIGPGGSVSMTVTARETGTLPNTEAGALLSTSFATDQIDEIRVGADGIGGGAEVEDHESYRARILFRLRYPPHGGAAHDYVRWALEIPGITRVWVDPLAYGPGTVGVWIMADANGSPYGAPHPVEVAAVAAYIESELPVTARVIVQAPLIAPIEVQLAGVVNPTEALQRRIEVELRDALRRSAAVSMPNARFTLRRNLLWQAVARATGDAVHTVEIPSIDVEMPVGFLPVLSRVCFV